MTQALGIPVLFLLESLKTFILEFKRKKYREKYKRHKKLNKRFTQVNKTTL
jgi:hypothetical protein